jgi:hypothetical protein
VGRRAAAVATSGGGPRAAHGDEDERGWEACEPEEQKIEVEMI